QAAGVGAGSGSGSAGVIYFQSWSIRPIILKIDYQPKQVSLFTTIIIIINSLPYSRIHWGINVGELQCRQERELCGDAESDLYQRDGADPDRGELHRCLWHISRILQVDQHLVQ